MISPLSSAITGVLSLQNCSTMFSRFGMLGNSLTCPFNVIFMVVLSSRVVYSNLFAIKKQMILKEGNMNESYWLKNDIFL